MKNSSLEKRLLDLVYGGLLFGVPNQDVSLLRSIRELTPRGMTLSTQHRDFLEAFNFNNTSEIISFYECKPSLDPVFVCLWVLF